MGHEVHVATANFPQSKSEEIIDGITVTRYKCLARPLRNPIVPDLLRLSKKIKEFDIVHTHNEHSFAAMVAAYFRRRTDVPLILTCHGQLIFGSKLSDWIERQYNKTIGRKIFETVDHIITLSSSDRQYVSSFGIDTDKINVLPNAIDLEKLSELNSNFESRDHTAFIQTYGLAGKKVIIFVGQVIQRKGIDYLLKSIPLVRMNTEEDIHLVLVGDGDFLDKTKQLINTLKITDHVTLTGSLSGMELISAYKCADIFVLPSLSEGLPTSILEAMYFGLPVVATDLPGVKDHFKDTALLVPPKNEKRLSDAIIKLINDKDLVGRLSKIGENLIKSRYTWDTIAKAYEPIYEV